MVKLTRRQKKYRRRILELSFKYKLSHLGSCLSVIDLIISIYETKKAEEKFVLSSGHAGIALYTVLEKHHQLDAEHLFLKHGIHPNRDEVNGIYCSTGSLGQGLPIALGMAFANKRKKTYCIITDGECSEGSVWETFRIAGDSKASNLRVLINANGYGAYGKINVDNLKSRIKSFGWNVVKTDGHNLNRLKSILKKREDNRPVAILAVTKVDQLSFLKGINAHYKIMSEDEYKLSMKVLI